MLFQLIGILVLGRPDKKRRDKPVFCNNVSRKKNKNGEYYVG